jgi:site-specific recombinase XerD
MSRKKINSKNSFREEDPTKSNTKFSDMSPRERALLAIMLYSGCRLSEADQLKLDDISHK